MLRSVPVACRLSCYPFLFPLGAHRHLPAPGHYHLWSTSTLHGLEPHKQTSSSSALVHDTQGRNPLHVIQHQHSRSRATPLGLTADVQVRRQPARLPHITLASVQLPVRVGVSLQRRKAASSNACKNTLWNVMVTRKPSSSFTTTSSSTSSSRCSSLYPPSALTDGWSADEADEMSADDSPPPRPLSVAIPKVSGAHGPYCPRRPNLREILANTSPSPWTLAAFMAYLSNNHCLETLEFTMDAGRYKKHYAKMLSKADDGEAPPAKDREYVQLLWTRLIDAYIQPNGSREVNLPSEVRDPILNLKTGDLPPPPEKLDPAVSKIYELMEESVLVPFINSCYPQSAAPTVSSMPVNVSNDSISTGSHHSRESSAPQSFKRHGRHTRSSPPPQTAVEPYAHTYSAPSMLNRKSAPSTLTTTLHKARFSMRLSPTTSSPSSSNPNVIAPFASATSGTSDTTVSASGSGSAGMTDDSTPSPTGDSPMTPPTSPPMSDLTSPVGSPRASRDSHNMWKKLGRLSGMKVGRKRSQSGLKEEQQ